MPPLKQVQIFTDGACLGNPGPGGYGAILRHGKREKELSGGYRRTTNNRMELMGVIKALAALKQPCQVTVCSDSEYVVKGITLGWAERWRSKAWRRHKNEMAMNWDLWALLLDLCAKHEVEFQWVRGHAGHPENERCDQLSVLAAQSADLEIDHNYENPPPPPPKPNAGLFES